MRFLFIMAILALVAMSSASRTMKEAYIRCSHVGQDCGDCCSNYIPGPGRECHEKITVWGQQNKADKYSKCMCMCEAPVDVDTFLKGFLTNGYSMSGKKK